MSFASLFDFSPHMPVNVVHLLCGVFAAFYLLFLFNDYIEIVPPFCYHTILRVSYHCDFMGVKTELVSHFKIMPGLRLVLVLTWQNTT